ncbi:MAG: hypothetical protein Q8P59_07970 [Dehalococcoidia bacterium]|nr:hypothetical protein [Dehalococcoidia bacterium]
MSNAVSAELYRKYKDQVLSLTTAHQRMEGQAMVGTISDRDIARKLGLSEEQVRDIRCLAEMEGIDMDWYPEAEEFKRVRAGRIKG